MSVWSMEFKIKTTTQNAGDSGGNGFYFYINVQVSLKFILKHRISHPVEETRGYLVEFINPIKWICCV